MSDLFNIPECPSPRLQWLEVNGVKFRHHPEMGDKSWVAYLDDYDEAMSYGPGMMAYGATQDDALVSLAKFNGWRLWNEKEAGK